MNKHEMKPKVFVIAPWETAGRGKGGWLQPHPPPARATWVTVRSHALCTQRTESLWVKSDLKTEQGDPEEQLPREKLVRTALRRPWRPGSQFPRPGMLHTVQVKNAPHRRQKRMFLELTEMIRSPGQVTILLIFASWHLVCWSCRQLTCAYHLSFLIITTLIFLDIPQPGQRSLGGAAVHGVVKCRFHFALLSTAWRPCNYLRSLNFPFSDSKFTKLVTDVSFYPTPILPSEKSLESGCRDSGHWKGPPSAVSQYICTGIPASEMYPYESVL